MSKREPLTLAALGERGFHRFWAASKSAASQRSNLKAVLDALGEQTKVEKITSVQIEQACERWMKTGTSPKTVNRRLSVLSKLLRYAVQHQLISAAPHIERYKEPAGRLRFVTDGEEMDLCRKFREADRPLYADLVSVLLDTGMRRGEALGLTWEQLEDRTDSLYRTLIRLEDTKSGRPRRIPATGRVHGILHELCRKQRSEAGPFTSIKPSTFEDAWNRVKREMGLADDAGFTAHALRHTFASRLLHRGARIEVVSRLLGHADIQTTVNVYYHELPGDSESAVSLLETACGPGGD